MERWVEEFIVGAPLGLLFTIIAVTLYTLGKGADWLVGQAVLLSLKRGISKMIIGATVVSLGTTTPETAVSVLAAIRGDSELALGNAVGSIICDTGLILGIATLISPPKLQKEVVNRQGWIQLGCGIMLVLVSLPYSSLSRVFTDGGRLPESAGFFFLGLLVGYLWLSVCWSNEQNASGDLEEAPTIEGPTPLILIKLLGSIALVVASSWVLIPAVHETALRVHVPDSIVAATLVAFGTSLPELVTAITAVRRGHGELAIGNVIGADILNVLFVAGASAAVTTGGLAAPAHFFRLLFPGMLAVLVIFRLGITFSKGKLSRPFGVLLLVAYLAITILSYVHR